jgi:GT2 family glycosyltransferase
VIKEPSVAIIILNWNGFDDTVECLRSLRQITYGNYKIVLVDNGSANNEGPRLGEMFPEIQLICNATNRGFAGGCNDGMNRAIKEGFEYIITLNNDCMVESSWLSNFIAGLSAAHADFGSSRIMYYPETHLICSDGDWLLADGTGYVLNPLKPFQEPGEIKTIFSACGAGAIFSSKCLEAVKIHGDQFFDELFFAYFEDIDLGLRLHALSFKGVSIPDAVIYHKESKAAGQRSFFQIYQNEKNRILVELLNFPLWMIFAGELYFCTRTLLRNLSDLFVKKPPRKDRPLPKKHFSPWEVLLKSRVWILSHLSAILADRRERKSRAMIDKHVYRYLCWDISRLLGIKR